MNNDITQNDRPAGLDLEAKISLELEIDLRGKSDLAPTGSQGRVDLVYPKEGKALFVDPGEQKAEMPSEPFVEVRGVTKGYRMGQVPIRVLRGASLKIEKGQFAAIIGQSGSGKSTLLHLMGTLDSPDSGEIHFDGRRIDNLPFRERDRLRNRQIGMIFQFYHLLPELNIVENVLAPVMIGEGTLGYLRKRRSYRKKASEMLEMVGLGHRLRHRPHELSGGEMQRVAIARSLVKNPTLLLADEPTGNLDHETGESILGMLRQLNREQNLTIVMVTHDPIIAKTADRTIKIADGQVS